MKNLLILLVATAIIFPSCKKTPATTTYMNTGTIKGQNLSMTVCGGAYWIIINDTTFHGAMGSFNSLPVGSGIDLNTATFPINVKLNWHIEEHGVCGIVVIDAIQKVD